MDALTHQLPNPADTHVSPHRKKIIDKLWFVYLNVLFLLASSKTHSFIINEDRKMRFKFAILYFETLKCKEER